MFACQSRIEIILVIQAPSVSSITEGWAALFLGGHSLADPHFLSDLESEFQGASVVAENSIPCVTVHSAQGPLVLKEKEIIYTVGVSDFLSFILGVVGRGIK